MSPGTQTILQLLGAIALLLWGLDMIRGGVAKSLGWRLRFLAARARGQLLSAFGVGAGLGACFQSSTAAILLGGSLVVNGVLSTSQGLALALGADVGATLAAQLLSFNLLAIAPFFAVGGLILNRFAKSESVRRAAFALFGFSLVIVALAMIFSATVPIREAPLMREIFIALESEAPIAVVVFALLTLLCHSSLAVVLLIIALAGGGAVSLESAFYMTLGANLGAGLPPLLGSIGEQVEMRRITLGNAIFRFCGVLIVSPFAAAAAEFASASGISPVHAVAHFHTFINLAMGVSFLLLTPACGQWLERQLRKVGAVNEWQRTRYLKPERAPQVGRALSDAIRETLNMGDLVSKMLENSFQLLKTDNRELRAEIETLDDAVDYLNREIKFFVADLPPEGMNEDDKRRANVVLSVITHLEHIGDIVDNNIRSVTRRLKERHVRFSADGIAEIRELYQLIQENLQSSLGLLVSQDRSLAVQMLKKKRDINSRCESMFHSHLNRLRKGRAESIETSSMHLDMVRDLKRINDHVVEMADSITSVIGEDAAIAA